MAFGMLGIGVERAWWNNWSLKLEYNYMDFGSKNYAFVGPIIVTENWRIDDKLHVVKLGLNYRFSARGP